MERVPLTEAEYQRAILEPGDLLFARRSVQWSGAGVCSIFVGSSEPTTFESSLIRVRLDRSKADPLFLFYYFRSPHGRRRIESIIEQTAVAGIKASELARLTISVPEPETQGRIAAVLRSLDDKIESNRRIAATLEGIAATLFKARFVDFVDHDDLVESEIGPIPRGWDVARLRDIATVTMGQSPPSSTYSDDPSSGPLMIQGKGTFGPRFPKPEVFCDTPGRLAAEGDLLMTVRAPVGELNICNRTTCLGRGVAGIASDYPGFIEFALRVGSDRWRARESGTIYPSVNKKQVEEFPLIMGPSQELDRYERAVAPMRAKIEVAHDENEILSALRDTLLPKLISGQIRVPEDAFEEVEAA